MSASITGMRNSEPAVARTTFGLNGSTEPGVSTTASAPAASAERMIVPALPGSPSRSATSTSDAAGGSTAGRMRTTASNGCGDSVEATRSTTPVAKANTDAPPATGCAAGTDELGLDLPPGVDGLGDEPGSFDDERTFLGTRTAAPEQAPQSLDPWVVERQRGAR